MSHTLVIRVLETVGDHPEKINHWYFGAGALIVLAGAMIALLLFAGGREHS